MKKLIYFLLVGFVFWGCNSENESDVLIDPETGMPIENVTQYSIENYVYEIILGPIPPTERRDACQIPVETLKKMTTQAVIQAILDHPMQMDIFLYNRFIQGFNAVYKDNNALAELVKRGDASELLLAKLVESFLDPNYPLLSFKVIVLEFVASQYLKGDLDKMKVFVESALKHDNQNQTDLFKDIRFMLIGRTMLAAKYKPFIIAVEENQFLQPYLDDFDQFAGYEPIGYNSNHLTQPIIIIRDFANNFINEK